MPRYTILIVLLSALLLSGCQDKTTNAYLLTHPDFLASQVAECQRRVPVGPDEQARCQRVMQAADTLAAFAAQLQANPEGFGQAIMKAERRCVQFKVQWQEATALQQADAKAAYEAECLKVKTMLALLGLFRPE